MKTAQHYKVTIFGDQYSLVSDESQEHMIKAAQLIDSLMRDVSSKATNADAKKIAVLVSLQIASTLLKLESSAVQDKEKQKQLIEFIDRECLTYFSH